MGEEAGSCGVPDPLVAEHLVLLKNTAGDAPVIDLACGDGHNGLFLAAQGLRAVLADRSEEALRQVERAARNMHLDVTLWKVDLEKGGPDPLDLRTFGAVIVFRYLHRPLIPGIRRSLHQGGALIYETFTAAQAQLGKPHNPAHLLLPGELREWFRDWEVIHYFEGITGSPPKAIAQLVCRKV